MTLEQWANIVEIIAAVAVIISLIFLGRELRQNTSTMRMTRIHSADNFVNLVLAMCTPVSTDRQFAELWNKGWSDFSSLDAVDKQRLVLFEWQAISAWHNWFNLRQKALISDEQWMELTGILRHMGKRQAIHESWKSFGDIYGPEFRKFMSELLELSE